MQFTSFALSALSVGSALAQAGVTVHVVRVGSMNGSLAYYPNNIKAAVGDMVQFQFAPNNHTVTQSTFDAPCQPIAANSNGTGIYSGFMPVSASSTTTPTYTIMVRDATPMWLYCSQGKHCQSGMTMVINENTAANSTRTLAGYSALAAQAAVNVPGTPVSGSSNSNTNTTTGTGTPPGPGSGSGSGTGTGTGTPPSSGSSRAGDAMGLGSLFAVAVALFL